MLTSTKGNRRRLKIFYRYHLWIITILVFEVCVHVCVSVLCVSQCVIYDVIFIIISELSLHVFYLNKTQQPYSPYLKDK